MEQNNEIFENANNLYKEQKYQEALQKYQILSEQTPNDLQLLSKISRCYIKLKDFDKALEIVNNCLEKDQSFATAYVIKSGIFYYKQQFEEMVECCKQGLKYEPNNKDLKYNLELGENSNTQNATQANDIYNALKSHPEIKEYFSDDDFVSKLSQALRDENYLKTCNDERIGKTVKILYEQTIGNKQENQVRAEEYKTEGNALYLKQMYKEAIEYYDEAIKFNSQEATYYSNKCICQIKLQLWKEAEETIDKGIELFEQKEYILIIQYNLFSIMNLSLQEKKKYSKLYLRKGVILENRSDLMANEFFQKVINLDPNDQEAIKKLGNKSLESAQQYYILAQKHLEEQKYHAALNQINLACKINESNSQFLALKAECQIKLLELNEALQTIEKALSINQDCKEVYPLKGQILQKQNKLAEAKDAFNKGLKLNPGNQICIKGIMQCSVNKDQAFNLQDERLLEIAKLVDNPDEIVKLLQKINDNPNSPESQALLQDPKIQLIISKLSQANLIK